MSISDKQWKAVGILVTLILALMMGLTTYSNFRGGVTARVDAAEESIDKIEPKVEINGRKIDTLEHQVGDMAPKVDEVIAHKERSETDMKWMKKTVESYDTKQQIIIEAIQKLQVQDAGGTQ